MKKNGQIEKMEKFKILNKASGSKDFTQSAQKQFDDTMKIINEMMELFELLSHTTMNPSNLNKLFLMFDAIPKELQKFQ